MAPKRSNVQWIAGPVKFGSGPNDANGGKEGARLLKGASGAGAKGAAANSGGPVCRNLIGYCSSRLEHRSIGSYSHMPHRPMTTIGDQHK